MKKSYIALPLCALLIASSAYATKPGSVYAGVSYGKIQVDENTFDLDDNTFKLFGGYQLSDLLAIEGHYASMDDTLQGVKFDASTIGVSGLFTPFRGQKLVPFGKIGINKIDAKAINGVQTIKSDHTKLSVGVGAMLALSNNISIRGEYERFDSDLNMLSIGISASF